MTPAKTLSALAEEYWHDKLASSPTEAHLLGLYDHAAAFEDQSRAVEDERIARLRDFVARATALDDTVLDDQDRVTRDVLVDDADNLAGLLEGRLNELAADPIFGPQAELPILFGLMGLPDADVAEAMVAKLQGVARSYEQLAERLREGVAAGRAPARFAVEGTVEQVTAILDAPVADDPLLGAVPAPPEGVDVDAWRGRLADVVEHEVRPAMAAYRDVLRDEVLDHARSDEECGLGALPDGADTYARALRFYTTTDLTAQQIHDIGLAQIASLAQEYRALGAAALGTDDLGEILEKMRTDPALHFTSGEQLVEASEVAMARAWEAMPQWFETLPQAPCVVEGTTRGAKAFYFPPADDGSRGGTFFINVDDPSSWGTFELEAMAFHEGIPGHHLQLAIAAELPDTIPEFRKHLESAAYAEGWGLYSERLSDEMGLYASDIDRLGMLAADSMRACRLVVDTGLHALGWSRQQAVDYMLANSPLTEGVVRPEVDRYAVFPGQATSYMVGRLEIQRMRREAEQRQGERFSVRAFHSAVLDSGALPLGVLDRVVAARLT